MEQACIKRRERTSMMGDHVRLCLAMSSNRGPAGARIDGIDYAEGRLNQTRGIRSCPRRLPDTTFEPGFMCNGVHTTQDSGAQFAIGRVPHAVLDFRGRAVLVKRDRPQMRFSL